MKLFRRKKRQLPVSFFAFQDIITALAGSLLIIVLAAAYCKSRPAGEINSVEGTADEFEANQLQIVQLEQQIKLQQFKLNTLLEQYKASDQAQEQQQLLRKQELAALELRRQLGDLQQIKKNYLQKLSSLDAEIKNADSKTLKLLAQAEENARLEQQLIERKQTQLFRSKDDKQPLLLECSQNGWFWSSKNTARYQLGADDPTRQQALNELRKLLKNYDPEKHLLVIAVRPSAGNMIQPLRMLLLREYPQWKIICEPLEFENIGGVKL